jgi:hypothetical protein
LPTSNLARRAWREPPRQTWATTGAGVVGTSRRESRARCLAQTRRSPRSAATSAPASYVTPIKQTSAGAFGERPGRPWVTTNAGSNVADDGARWCEGLPVHRHRGFDAAVGARGHRHARGSGPARRHSGRSHHRRRGGRCSSTWGTGWPPPSHR